ncbi:VWA domain-containing protein [Alloscardovia theropitheci]|uniref:VWA domain-containing protein n=1 Tax=Alloscardovia theropitheci TaxID=2496842 RepID=A0A4R0QRB3_9BIFI|nr:VWA domain-containing protein [Alloscardovia theropitheci]TCD54893.1 VWA domain-containing protein [Alloscardovia theropitheci]
MNTFLTSLQTFLPTRLTWPIAGLLFTFVILLAIIIARYIVTRLEHRDEELESSESTDTDIATDTDIQRPRADSARDAFVFNIENDYLGSDASRFVSRYKRGSIIAVITLVVSILCASLLVSRPSTINPQQANNSSRDIILCLDVSGSALAYDRQIIAAYSQLVNNLHGERIGLSIFNSTSKTVFPLTDDYSVISNQLNHAYDLLSRVQTQESIDAMSDEQYQEVNDWLHGTQNVENSTSLIGDGLVSCTMMLPQLENSSARNARSASIVLATDNVPSGKQTFTLDEALQIAHQARINVDALYVGSNQTSNSQEAQDMRTAIEANGGTYVDLNANDTVEDIVRDITSTKSGPQLHDDSSSLIDAPGLIVLISIIALLVFVIAAGRIRR